MAQLPLSPGCDCAGRRVSRSMALRPVPIDLDLARQLQFPEPGYAQYSRLQGSYVWPENIWPETPSLDAQWSVTPESGASLQGFGSDEMGADTRTTLVLKNLPRHFDKDALKDLLEKLGFRGFFDFLYVPLQWNQESCVGYGLVNLTSHEVALRLWNHFRKGASENLEVCWDTRHQGLDQLIKYYRNNSVMHPLLPEHCKPMLLLSGEKVDFPPPTKALTTPKSLRGSKFRKSWGDAKDKLVNDLLFYLKEAEAKTSQ
ncbi:unnamed protein product [Durusdinium trenchii]|uniref:Protein terminal ear1 n=2 Tax=Durusdinium trenchii TaxID=1381693 RepID=A0ABP0LYB8_9DINO